MEASLLFLGANETTYQLNCSGDLTRGSCHLPQTEEAKRDVIAVLRSILSSLSIIGTFSIIISVVFKKQICSPKIHPIMMLSIADFILAVLWMVGGTLWLSENSSQHGGHRSRCFAVLLMTVIVECVTVNLTCVYALMAYSSVKQKDFSNIYSLFEKDLNKHVWKPWQTILVYLIAWVIPVVLVLVPFFILNHYYGYIEYAGDCTCWCVPYFGNVIPYANTMDKDTAKYVYRLAKFVLAYSIVTGLHYVVGFVLLVVVYWIILARIRRMRTMHRDQTKHHNLYGATEAIIIKGQSQAKTRVVFFLTVFIITGFFNVILSTFLARYATTSLTETHDERSVPVLDRPHAIPTGPMVAYLLQSITVPLQGFLNAIVYGWTREDFVQAVSTTTQARNAPAHKSPWNQEQQGSKGVSSVKQNREIIVSCACEGEASKTKSGIMHMLSDSSDSD